MRFSILLPLVLVPFMVQARIPKAASVKLIDIKCEIGMLDGNVYMGMPSLTIDGATIECHCGKRATCIGIIKGKVVGLCIDHEEYNVVNPAHESNWCVGCGSKSKSPNIADKKK